MRYDFCFLPECEAILHGKKRVFQGVFTSESVYK